MVRFIACGAVFCLFIIFPPSLSAQQPWEELFRNYVFSDNYLKQLRTKAIEGQRDLFPECNSFELGSRNKVSVGQVPEFNSKQVPVSGLWRDQVVVAVCGVNRLTNMHFFANKDGDPEMLFGLSGTTLADLQLQVDAINIAALETGRTSKGCKNNSGANISGERLFVIVDTRFDRTLEGGEIANADTKTWWETWTVRECGLTREIKMKFIHKPGTGTGIFSGKSADK